MSAMPMPTCTLSLPNTRICWSYLTLSVPNRLYGVSKSNLPVLAAIAADAATLATELPPPTAPASAVRPAFFRNDRRPNPSCCAMRLLRHECRDYRIRERKHANTTPGLEARYIFITSGASTRWPIIRDNPRGSSRRRPASPDARSAIAHRAEPSRRRASARLIPSGPLSTRRAGGKHRLASEQAVDPDAV